jgi:hypothetical protein
MFLSWKTLSKAFPIVAVLLGAILVGGTVIKIYSKTFSTIKTNDGQVDSNWSETPLVTDPLGDHDPIFAKSWTDITGAWFSLDAPVPTEYYFRIEVASSPIENGGTAHIDLDCNSNGTFTDPALI